MSVTITTTATGVTLSAPFNRELSPEARAIGGRWNPDAKAWTFAAVDEERVRDLAREIYGTDGSDSESGDLVSVRVDASRYSDTATIELAGRIILEKRSRDEAPRLGVNVIRVSGSFRSHGGSMRYPEINENDVILEVRGVPRAAATAAGFESECIIEPVGIDRVALEAERQRIASRLAEIDALLAV